MAPSPSRSWHVHPWGRPPERPPASFAAWHRRRSGPRPPLSWRRGTSRRAGTPRSSSSGSSNRATLRRPASPRSPDPGRDESAATSRHSASRDHPQPSPEQRTESPPKPRAPPAAPQAWGRPAPAASSPPSGASAPCSGADVTGRSSPTSQNRRRPSAPAPQKAYPSCRSRITAKDEQRRAEKLLYQSIDTRKRRVRETSRARYREILTHENRGENLRRLTQGVLRKRRKGCVTMRKRKRGSEA